MFLVLIALHQPVIINRTWRRNQDTEFVDNTVDS